MVKGYPGPSSWSCCWMFKLSFLHAFLCLLSSMNTDVTDLSPPALSQMCQYFSGLSSLEVLPNLTYRGAFPPHCHLLFAPYEDYTENRSIWSVTHLYTELFRLLLNNKDSLALLEWSGLYCFIGKVNESGLENIKCSLSTLFSIPEFSKVWKVSWRHRLAVFSSVSWMVDRWVTLFSDSTSGLQEPCLLSCLSFTSWITWDRKSCVRCSLAAWSSMSSPSASSEVDESASSFSGAERKTILVRRPSQPCPSWRLPTYFFGVGSVDAPKFRTTFLQLILNLIFVAADFSCRNQSIS